jgi:hypothetical protein
MQCYIQQYTVVRPSSHSSNISSSWIGCVSPSASGHPCALYTGVQPQGATCSGHKTRECALHEPMVHSDCWVLGCVNLDELPWNTLLRCVGCIMEGWRDPFVYQRTALDGSRMFQMILGSGMRTPEGQKQGMIMRYSARDLCGPWKCEGTIAEGSTNEGRVWECPALVEVLPVLLYAQGSTPSKTSWRYLSLGCTK